jgi:hypothetical protein
MTKKFSVAVQSLSFILFGIGLFFHLQHFSENTTKAFLISGSFLNSIYLVFFQKDKDDFAIKLIAGLISANCLVFIYSHKIGLNIYIILLSILVVYSYFKTKREQVIQK